MKSIILIFTLVLIGALGVMSCERTPEEDSPTPVNLTNGKLVFEDDFEREEIGPNWKTGFEGWEISEGALGVQGARNDALWLQEPLPEIFRVSFTARSESEAGDIKFEILGDGATHESGYVGIFGGWQNRLNIIARLDEHGDDRREGAAGQTVEPGKTYKMDVLRLDDRLLWYVDGELFLAYDDGDSLRGEEHRYFAFNNWDTLLFFDDLQVFDLGQ